MSQSPQPNINLNNSLLLSDTAKNPLSATSNLELDRLSASQVVETKQRKERQRLEEEKQRLSANTNPTENPLLKQPNNALGNNNTNLSAPPSVDYHDYNIDPPVTVYYSQDPIENLQIRVLLRPHPENIPLHTQPITKKALTLAIKTKKNKAETEKLKQEMKDRMDVEQKVQAEMSGTRIINNTETNQDNSHVIAQIIDWQQKIHGPRDILRWTNHAVEKKTPLHSQYAHSLKDWLNEISPGIPTEDAARQFVSRQGGVRISTMCEEDGYIDPRAYSKKVVESKQELNPLAKKITELPLDRRGKSHLARDNKFSNFFILASVNIPSDVNEMNSANRINRLGYEHVLAHLRSYDNGTLELKPGFSPIQKDPTQFDTNEWYEFYTEKGQRWRYRIENAHDQYFAADSQQFQSELTKIEKREALLAKNKAGYEFTKAPGVNHFQLNCYGEIIKLTGFEDSHLYIQYELHIPEGWNWSKNDPYQRNSSVTQISESMDWIDEITNEPETTTNFGFPIEFELIGDNAKFDLHYPTIYFQINSIDFWDVHRVVGYAYTQIPTGIGSHEFKFHCWKPVQSVSGQRDSYFVGGGHNLQDLKLMGIPPGFNEKFLNRYGLMTENTGYIHCRFEIARIHPKHHNSQTQFKSLWKNTFESLKQGLTSVKGNTDSAGSTISSTIGLSGLRSRMASSGGKAALKQLLDQRKQMKETGKSTQGGY